MPDEPRKSIEELLQASAKARRAEFGSDPKMPNPMRARLHEEIARAAREEEPKLRRTWNWFAISWPVGTVAAAVLVAAFVMSRSHELQPPRESRKSAKNQHERAKEILQRPAPQVAAARAATERATEPADVAKGDEAKSNAAKTFADVASAPAQEMPGASPKAESSASSSTFFAQSQKTQTNINQQFSQNLRAGARASKLKQAISVLNTFQVQQNGDQIRVVDADGSTYTGKIEPATDAMRQAFKDKEVGSLAARSERDRPQQDNNNQFYFRASGYNTSLKKPIVIEANYIATPAQAQAPNESPTANQQQLPARIVGTAKVNGESPIEVDAASIPQ
jgi:hypothetical protein